MFTLKAFEIVEDILSRIKPPAKVPKIPQTIVIPPNNKSALLCQKKKCQGSAFLPAMLELYQSKKVTITQKQH